MLPEGVSGMGRPPEDAPCGVCRARTYAAHASEGRIYRECRNGHRCVFIRDKKLGLIFQRLALTADDQRDDRPCDFPGCGRPRKARFCQGHAKQRQRHGEDGMRPLMPPMSKMTKADRAEHRQRVLDGILGVRA